MKKVSMLIILSAFVVSIFATPPLLPVSVAKAKLLARWRVLYPKHQIVSVNIDKHVNWGKPWKYKRGYTPSRQLIMMSSYAFVLIVNNKGKKMRYKVDVVYRSVGNGPWKYSHLSIGTPRYIK